MPLAIGIAALILATIALAVGIVALIELRSFNKSTHQVQYVPHSDAVHDQFGFEVMSEETKNKLQGEEI
jgi:hypothetical protein